MSQRIFRTVGDMALKTEALLQRLRRKTSKRHASAELITESELFDAVWYRAHYPEAGESDISAALHYVRVGAAQGHDPGPSFSSSYYLSSHPDVAAAGMNPLVHYLRFGLEEGRAIAPAGTRWEAAEDIASTPWNVRFDAPLEAAEPVRFPLQPWPEPDVSASECAQLGANRLSLSGISLGFVGTEWGKLRTVAAFAELSSVAVSEALRADSLAAAIRGAPAPDAMFSLGSAATFDFADVWFINDRDLRARLDAPLGCRQRFLLSCYQYQPEGERRLVRLEQAIPRGELDFVDFATENPYLPLLFTLTTHTGQIVAATLLPFPSLCRHGPHYGELLATSDGKDYLTALRAASHLLVKERLCLAQPAALARIEIDLARATGAERIFSADLRNWLALDGCLAIVPATRAHSSEGLVRRHLEESSSTPAAEDPGRPLSLRLPADAIPSLRVLVSRELPLPRGSQHVAGAFVVAADAGSEPRWCLTPSARADLAALQPEGGGGFPILRCTATRESPPGEQVTRSSEAFPLAVRFCDFSPPHPARLIAPVAPEATEPLLPGLGAVDSAATRLSVVHDFDGSPAHLAAFLESLQRQQMAAVPEVILTLAADRNDDGAIAAELLRRYFPLTGRLVRHPASASSPERFQAAAIAARGRFLVLVGGDVVLHDARTLVTLLALAQFERAASASCLVIAADDAENPSGMKFVSAGYYGHAGVGEAATLHFDACADLAALPPATWPVAANASHVLMVRSDVWRELGGFAGAASQREADLAYAARATMAGYSNYCTSVLSVTLLGDARASCASASDATVCAGTMLRRLVA